MKLTLGQHYARMARPWRPWRAIAESSPLALIIPFGGGMRGGGPVVMRGGGAMAAMGIMSLFGAFWLMMVYTLEYGMYLYWLVIVTFAFAFAAIILAVYRAARRAHMRHCIRYATRYAA